MIVNIIGMSLIIFLAFWFWYPKKEAGVRASSKKIRIVVADGVYSPSQIEARVGQHIILEFIREDKTPCSEMVIFPDFDQSLQLNVGEPKIIKITPKFPGEFEFTCQMGMYRGKLLIEGNHE
jgi:plastocyanin domain-containing protein